MTTYLGNLKATLKGIGVFALCFVMLAAMLGMTTALADGIDARAEANRDDNIEVFGTVTYTGLPTDGYLEQGDSFTMDIYVTEQGHNTYFDLDKMYLELPEGLSYVIKKPGEPHVLNISISDHGTGDTFVLKGNVSVDENTNKLLVVWDKTSEGYPYLEKVTNANYSVQLSATVNGSSDVIDLGTDGRFYVHNTAHATFTKSFGPTAAANRVKSLYDAGNANAPKFTTTVTVAKTGTAGPDEFIDNNGIIRNKTTGKIVYVQKEVTFSLKDMTYDASKKSYFYSLPNLKPNEDAGITVTETQHLDLSAYGFTYNTNNQPLASTPALAPFSSETCSLINHYTQDTGKLTLSKSFHPSTPAINSANITNAQKQSIEITVSGKTLNGTNFNKTITYNQMTNGSYTIGDIPAGNYTVTETAVIDGYRWVVAQYRVDGVGGMTTADGAVDIVTRDGEESFDKEYVNATAMGSVNIGKGETHTVELQNGYVQKLGNLTLNKNFEGSLTEAQKDRVTFVITTTVNGQTKYVWFRAGIGASYEFVKLSDNPADGSVYHSAFTYGYLPNGASGFSFRNLPEGTYTITETRADFSGYARTTTYTVNGGSEQTPKNETNPYFSVSVTDKNTTAAVINNKYVEKGSLTVSKQVSGATLNSDQKKAITFQLEKKNANGQWVAVGKPVTYYSMSNGKHTWNNLAFGEYRVVESAGTVANYTLTTTYTVKENVTGGSTTTSNGTGTTAEVDVINPYAGSIGNVKTFSAAEANFTNTYQPITTDMTITKLFSGDYPLPADKTKLEGKITFQVKDGNTTLRWVKQTDGSYKLGSGNGSVTNIPYSALGSDGTVRLTGLQVGKEYTIIEMNSALDGYNRYTYVNNSTTPAASNSNPSGKVTLRQNNTASTTFTNTYDPVATLKVEKSFTGVLPDAYCNEHILPELKFVISTVVDGQTMYVTSVSGAMSPMIADAMKFPYNTIANGVTLQGDRQYTVTEYGREVNGYLVTTWNTVDGELTTGTSGDVYVAPNGTGLIKFTNRYLQADEGIIPTNAGAVQSHKTWTGLDNGPSDGTEGTAVKNAVRFDIFRSVNGTWKLYDTYTLGELTSGMTTYEVLNQDGTKTTVTAPILLPIGSYKLVEREAGYQGYIHKATVSVLYNSGEGVGTDDRNQVDKEMTSAGISFTVRSGDSINFSIANVYYPLGKLTVTKTIDQTGDLKTLNQTQRALVDFALYSSETPNTAIAEFDLIGVSGSQNPYNIKVTVGSGSTSYTITIENLPIGYFRLNESTNTWELVRHQYTIKESNAVANYNCETTVTINKSQTAGSTNAQAPSGTVVLYKLSPDESANVAAMTFNNKYMRQNGSLKVTKEFEYADNLTSAQKNQVNFQIFTSTGKVVSWNNVNGQHVYSANGAVNCFFYGAMENGEYVVTGLPTGGYYVVETDANFDPYLRTTHFTVTNGIGVTTNETTTTEGKSTRDQSPNVTVSSGATSTAAVKNTYHATGSLKLTKTFAFEGNAQMSEDLRKSIVFTLKQGNTVIASGSLASEGVTYDAATNSYTYTFYDLPVGEYTIIESNADPSGYVRTTTVVVDGKTTVSAKTARDGLDTSDNGTPSASFKVDHGEQQQVQFTNTYSEYGTLKVTKTFVGLDDEAFSDKSNWDPSKIIFAVRDADGNLLSDSNGNYVKDAKGNPIGTVTYAQLSGSAILTLPAGMYTVEEIIIDESNNIVDTWSLFYKYIHNSTQYVIAAGDRPYGETIRQGADGEVGNVETEPFRVGASNATVAFTNNYTKVNPLKAEKDCEGDPFNADGLPVWEFNVTITNLSDLNTVNGETTLRDVYEIDETKRGWFKLYTAPGYEPKITSTNGGMVKSYKDNGDGSCEFVISVEDANGKAAGESITLTYFLQVEDKNDFAALTASEADITNPGLPNTDKPVAAFGTAKWTFTNTVYYREYPAAKDWKSDPADYRYGMSPIRKTVDSEDGSPIVTFTLDINPEGIHIGTEQTLTIYDKMSDNVQVDMLSIQIEPSDIANQVTTNKYNGDKWDLVITVPNDKHVRITYTGTIMETGHEVAVTNQASLNGINAVVKDVVDVSGDSDGTASVVQIKLFKLGEGNYNERLEGAKFYLYAADDTDFSDPLGTYVTNAEGIARIAILDDKTAIKENVPYVLKEVEAPVGYQLNDDPIYFTITTDTKQVDHANNIFHFTELLECENAPLSTEVTFEATKVLNGRALTAGQFTFGLYDQNGYRLQTATNDATGKVTFETIPYTYRDIRAQNSEDGTATLTYTIKEEVPTTAAPGYTYDTNEYQVTVTLSLSEDGTELLADVAYPTAAGLTFTNTYKAEGSFTLEGTKTVTNATVVREAFEFEIWDDAYLCSAWNSTGVEGDEAPINYPTFQYVLDPDATEDVTYDRANRTVIITANELSSFQFSIREKPSLNSAYDCDDNRYTLTVTAVDNGDGTLQVNGALKLNGTAAGDTADFTNEYLGSLNIQKNVTVGGKSTNSSLADGSYTFNVYSDEACTTLVDDCVITITNGESNTATVSGLVPGIYYVKEVEEDSSNEHVSLVGKKVVEVTVSGDANVTAPTATFTNNRDVGQLSVKKTMTGTNADSPRFMFVVTVEGADGTYDAESTRNSSLFKKEFTNGSTTVVIEANETITIKGLPAGAAYTVAEVIGFQPDDTPITSTVTGTNVFYPGYSIGAGSGLTGTITANTTAVAVQNNIYKAQGIDDLVGVKNVNGSSFVRDSYKFEIKDAEGKVVYTVQAPTGVGHTNIPYPDFQYVVDPTATAGTTYNEENRLITVTVNSTRDLKEAVYTISEKADPNNASCQYDDSVYTVTVTPTDVGDGTVLVDISLTKSGASVDLANFTNQYLGSLIIRKNVTVGGQPTESQLADGTYEFHVFDDDQNIVGKPTITITNGQSNTAVVTGLVPGNYRIMEMGGNNPNVTLVSTRIIDVNVSADNQAELPEAPVAEFTNDRPVGDLTLVKVLSGTDDPDTAFEFTVTIAEAAGQTYQTETSNGISSEVTFDSEYGIATITVTAGDPVSILDLPAGAAYTVAEVDAEGDGYTPGTITGATGTISKNATVTVTQTNVYAAEAIISLSGTKTVNGATIIRESFTFQIKDGDNAPWTVTTPVTDEAGNTVAIPYPSIKYVTSPSAQSGTTYDAANNMIIVSATSAGQLPTKVFTITEVAGTNTAYTYDASVYTLTTNATDNGDGTLSVGYSVKKNGVDVANTLDFTNAYFGSLEIKKNVTYGGEPTDTTWVDGIYNFGVYSDVGCTNLVAECSITIEGGQSNTATVSGLAPGLYYVKEIGGNNEFAKLASEEVVSVSISGDANAKVPTVEFTNNCGVGSLTVTKTVSGTTANDRNFRFKLTVKGAANKPFRYQYSNGDTILNASFTGNSNADGTYEFTLKAGKTITFFGLPEGAAYAVEEVIVPVGYTLGTASGLTGVIEANKTAVATQNNIYKAEGRCTIRGTKTVQDATAIRDTFKFYIKYNGNVLCVLETETNAEGNTMPILYPTFKFVVDPTAEEGMVYDSEKNVITMTSHSAEYLLNNRFKFTISEQYGDGSYVYDPTVYTLTVTTENNDDTGRLTLSTDLRVNNQSHDMADFNNAYLGSLKIEKNVTLGGEETETNLADGTYGFTVYSDAECTTAVATTSITITNGASNTATVTGLKPGTYYVKETSSNNENVPLLTKTESVTVSTDANDQVQTARFTNNRGVGDLMLLKTVTGTEDTTKTFSFKVTVKDHAGLTYSFKTSNSDTVSNFAFSNEDDSYVFTLKANESVRIYNLPSGAEWTIEEFDLPSGYVSTNGNLREGTIAAGTMAMVNHNNTYGAEGYATLQVNKLVEGYEGDGIFTFILTDAEGNEIRSAECGANDTAVFERITYTLPGTYHYTITEVTPELEDRVPGMQYNSETYYATVVVTDNRDGTLSTAVTYGATEEEVTDEELTITNLYAKPEGEAVLSVMKAMTGNTDAYIADEDFSFVLAIDEHELTSETNNILVPADEDETEPSPIRAAKLGATASWTLKYDEPGTYTYTITEVEGATPGMAYDTTAHAVTVVVEYTDDLMALQTTVIYPVEEEDPEGDDPNGDDPETGDPEGNDPEGTEPDGTDPEGGDPESGDPDAIVPQNEDPDADEAADTLIITNKYSEISYQPRIKKVVEGSNAPDEIFTFTLTDGAGNTDTASCKAGETALFSEIVYHEPGTYVYTVTEELPDRQTVGMNYSKQVVTITVTVTSIEDGTLEATAEYTDEGTIVNKYVEPPKYDYKFSFTKKWSGGVEESIEWTLYNPNGTVAHKKFNKQVLSETEWYYEGWFATNKQYYIIEDVPEGYQAIYVNVGEYADVTDRLYNGGTIINYKTPKTGDSFDPLAAAAALVTSGTLLAALVIYSIRRKRSM